MNGSTIAISCASASSLTASAQASSVGAVAASSGSMRSSILPPWKPRRADRVGVVAGEAVVDLEGCAGQAAAVHRADHDLVLEGAEQQQVLEDVGGAEHAVDAWPLEGDAQPAQQLPPVGHRHRRRRRRAARRGPGGRRRPASADRSAPTKESGRRRCCCQLGDPLRRADPGRQRAQPMLVGASCACPLEELRRPRPSSAWRRRRPADRPRSHRRRWRSASIRSSVPARRATRGTARRRRRHRHRVR